MLLDFGVILIVQTSIALWAAITLVTCETFLARGRPTWRGRLRALRFWAIYLPVQAALILAVALATRALGLKPLLDLKLSPPATLTPWLRWPLTVAALVAAAAVSDFCYYWMHRAQHAVPLFWRFHAVHHAIRDLNAVNAYHHCSEELLRAAFIALPAALLVRIEAGEAMIVSCLIVFQMWWIHAPLRVGWGPFRRVLSDGHFHRIHHSLEARHWDRNFAAFTPIWDQLFGTAYFPGYDEWPATGLAGAPEVETVGDYVLRPLRASRAARAEGVAS